jgi:hypothetical protein
MRDTFTEWIETFTAKPWYRAFALLVMIVIAIDVWRDRGLVVGVLACSLYVGVIGSALFATNPSAAWVDRTGSPTPWSPVGVRGDRGRVHGRGGRGVLVSARS